MDKFYIVKELAGIPVDKVEITEEELRQFLYQTAKFESDTLNKKIRKVLE